MSNFKELSKINVNSHVEKKNGLTYLSWAWAWDMFKNAYPDATYKVIKNDNGIPYFETQAGVMVYTEVTAGGLTHEMWLPVMDGANMAMKQQSYTYKTKYGEKTCDAFDMFDVNKTIMRCLVKNLAMFGLALYIYAGEDIPQEDKVQAPKKVTPLAGAMESLDEESQQFIRDLAMDIISDVDGGFVEDAHGKTSSLLSEEKIAVWSLLDSKTRSSLKKYAETLKG